MSLYSIIFLFVCMVFATAFAEPDPVYYPNNPPKIVLPTYRPDRPGKIIRPTYNPSNPAKFIRVRRFSDGNRKFDGQNPQSKQKDWEFKPDISRDQSGNTRGQVSVQKRGENHDFEAGYGKVFRGPDKHSETWHVGGSVRW